MAKSLLLLAVFRVALSGGACDGGNEGCMEEEASLLQVRNEHGSAINSTWGGMIGGRPGDRTLLCKITFYSGKDCDDGGSSPYGYTNGNKMRSGSAIRMNKVVDQVLECKSNCDEGTHTDKYLENHAVAWKINWGGVGDGDYGCDHIEIYDEDNPKKGYGDNVIMDKSDGTMGKTGQCNVLPDDLSEDVGGYYIKGYEN